MMTREDVLRELELLPVWQLRSPIAVKDTLPGGVSSVEPKQDSSTQPHVDPVPYTSKIEEIVLTEVKVELPEVPCSYRYLTCEHGHWLFVLADAELSEEQQHLLGNIFKAMQLKIKPATITENLFEIVNTAKPKLLVSMGESTTQAMLRSSESLDDLRGKPHQFEGVALIATYDTAHLLNNLLDKAKAWADIRFAMQLMNDLKN